MTNQSFVNIAIPTTTFIGLVDFLRKNGSSRDPVEIVHTSIHYWMENASWKHEALLPDVFDQEKGYRWKQLLLPHGTLIRMKYKGQFHYAKVEGDLIKHDERDVSPSEFANLVTGTSRNAWRDLEVKRPQDSAWFLADFLRDQEERCPRTVGQVVDVFMSDEEFDIAENDLAWFEVVERALINLRGKAHLLKIEAEVTNICKQMRKKIPKELGATIRGTLEDNSSDSERYKGVRDIFYSVEGRGSGIWGLRNT